MVWFPPQTIASLTDLPWPEHDGPLVVYHPAAHRNHSASLSLALEAERPLLHVSNDTFAWWPEGVWPAVPGDMRLGRRSTSWMNGDELRLYGPPPHAVAPVWPVHTEGDAWRWMRRLPSIDVLYLDWTDWFADGQVQHTNPSHLASVVSTCLPHLRDGAVVVVDHKTGWSESFSPSTPTNLGHGAVLKPLGRLSWLDLLPDEGRVVDASVFSVHHPLPLKPLTWRQMLAPLAPEVEWSAAQCDEAQQTVPAGCPLAMSPEAWDLLHMERVDSAFHGIQLEQAGPRPKPPWTVRSWTMHLEGVRSLLDHSDSLA
jgi:hypothetical protein